MKLNKTVFIPHRWLELKGLRRIFTVGFYIPAVVFVYSAVQWIYSWTIPAEELATYSAPVRQLLAAAAIQGLLLMLVLAACIQGLKLLEQLEEKTVKK